MNPVFNNLLRPVIKVKHLLISSVVLGSLTLSAQAATVSVSNHPMYLLSQAVTDGTPSANKILQAGDVGHHGSVSPSDMKAIRDSKYVVWFGPSLENSLNGSLKKAPNAIAVFDFDAFNRYPLRDVKGAPIEGTFDPHIWLDPENAKGITRALAVIHSRANPEHESIYHENVKKFAERMDNAVAAIQQQNGQTERPYWAYHDAYQYIERAAQIKLTGTLSTDHHLSPKASQLRWMNENRPTEQMCLVNQGPVAKGLLAKLQPVSTTAQIEDMSDSQDFVEGWTKMAQQINSCIGGEES
ncbi:zinc ABC transporter substrate-binding protein [Psychrobacter sp.]|uniref:metal ABC transporter solute-binding protein, Zn/Mn family n=1 Tax=Psychrobacter sp. TaxID=56811 RepID=UPI002649400B|nr:zinc ABC transporter substrate-binding protein [Psychrobacter sp.]MDN6275271.1 zinc ABC transporter substrate-binding protein [Psychrobacter sp.]MDN6307596.1 zinc ABC transporter substrate-binding protein [Psychrobacter sp.]